MTITANGWHTSIKTANIKKEVQKCQINEKLNKIYKTTGKILL